ncbi:MAG: cytochrome c [Trueperaceae bacterium]|nr:cytochrome c [Trueperaceae bacterium]
MMAQDAPELEPAPEEVVEEELGTEEAAPEETAPEETAPEETAPEETAPEETASEETAPEEAPEETPEETTEETTETLAQADTEQTAPAEEAPEEATEEATEETAEAEPVSLDYDEELGQSTYQSNCLSCHQANGQGITGAFPPLVEHVPNLYNAEGGRDYLINLQLYGLQGQIDVLGSSYNGVMPAWQQLSDEQIAAVLNHISLTWGNAEQLEGFTVYTADEIAPLRGQGLSPADVYELRQALELPY